MPNTPLEGRTNQAKFLDDIILERLVALNAERAEEERNGYIRWLRPDYQEPNTKNLRQIGASALSFTAL